MIRKPIDWLLCASLLFMLLAIAGCGGGDSGPAPANPQPTTPTPPATVQNAQAIVVDAGPPGVNVVNVPYTSVTICVPGSGTACQTIDHILVDTGSSGLRIMASVLNAGLPLPQQFDSTGKAIVECIQFADGFSWGPVKMADIKLAGESAAGVPIQIIGDPNFGAIPSACSSSGPAENTVRAFGSNGVLGVGHFLQDCGPVCAQVPNAGVYYLCSGGSCQSSAVPVAQQVANPVARFATDNNGVVIILPAIPATGASNVGGTLVFGIGTQANNAVGNAKPITLDPNTAQFTTVLGSKTYPESFIDSGSNGLFFPSTLPTCGSAVPGFYCPQSTQTFTALMQGKNGANAAVDFSVANAVSLFNSGSLTAFNDLAGANPNPNSFDWGLPFFFGRTVYTAIEGRTTPAGSGPYVAF